MASKAPSDNTPAPSLLAFGGWSDAPWFDSSVLADAEVVTFSLPKLDGLRKQVFHIIDRTVPDVASGKAAEVAPKRVAGKLARLLDTYGTRRAIASCRSKFLFESGPILFFAELPAAKLKQRAATKLRREVIELGLRACMVRADAKSAIAMFWPAAETAITEFVDASVPEHAIHPEFDRPPGPAVARDKLPADREAKLLRQIATLQAQVTTLAHAQSAVGAMEQLGLDDARLKSMLKLLHPDKHGNSEAANEAAKWLNSMRELLKGK